MSDTPTPDLQPHQSRVIEEKDQLFERLEKLEAFLKTEAFAAISWEEQNRLKLQKYAMELYHHILESRIANFL